MQAEGPANSSFATAIEQYYSMCSYYSYISGHPGCEDLSDGKPPAAVRSATQFTSWNQSTAQTGSMHPFQAVPPKDAQQVKQVEPAGMEQQRQDDTGKGNAASAQQDASRPALHQLQPDVAEQVTGMMHSDSTPSTLSCFK